MKGRRAVRPASIARARRHYFDVMASGSTMRGRRHRGLDRLAQTPADPVAANASTDPGGRSVDKREDGLTVPDPEADRLEQRVGEIRSHIDGLVSELNHRRHVIGRRYGKPFGIAAAVAGAGTIGALVYWRVKRQAPSRRQRLRGALD